MGQLLGFDREDGLVYLGSAGHGQPIWPTPTLLPAYFLNQSSEHTWLFPSDGRANLVFLELSYDPVSNVRRGRLYNAPQDGRV